jgi:carbon starvation protein
MKHSPWATFTVSATIPIAMIVGVYMRYIRVGQVLEASALGVVLLLLAVAGGRLVDENETLRVLFDQEGLTLAWWVMAYGFAAAIFPVWLLLAPRDYLSTYMKLGTITLLAVAIILLQPSVKMPAMTQFIDGTGPIFAGRLFPFVFITIACGAISGFHALIASGTTPKLLSNERDIRMIGYGGMLLESFVAIMALIAATVLDPGVFFAINSSAGVVGKEAVDAVAKISSWGYPVTVEQMQLLAQQMGEATLFARTGGAPSLAVGMASIFGSAFGQGMLALWYHFAIMFEAIFILTTLDAGTRVGRFMLQDILGNKWAAMGRTSWLPSVIFTSAIVVSAWGYFLYIGVIDPNGGVNILWPLFGIANQMLAAIALSVATGILVKWHKGKYAFITAVPLLWLVIITSTAAWQKLTSDDIRIGFLSAANDLATKLAAGVLPTEKAAIAPKLIFNLQLDAVIVLIFVSLLWLIVLDMLRVCVRYYLGKPIPDLSEVPHSYTRLEEAWVRD